MKSMSSIIQASLIATLIICEMFYGDILYSPENDARISSKITQELEKEKNAKLLTFERLHKRTE